MNFSIDDPEEFSFLLRIYFKELNELSATCSKICSTLKDVISSVKDFEMDSKRVHRFDAISKDLPGIEDLKSSIIEKLAVARNCNRKIRTDEILERQLQQIKDQMGIGDKGVDGSMKDDRRQEMQFRRDEEENKSLNKNHSTSTENNLRPLSPTCKESLLLQKYIQGKRINDNNNDQENCLSEVTTVDSNLSDEISSVSEDPHIFESLNIFERTLGYNPLKEDNYCRFYDKSIGGCFKGTNCKKIHRPKNEDGQLIDHKPAQVYLNDVTPVIVYPKGAKLKLLVTCITSLTEFWAQIVEDGYQMVTSKQEPLIWIDADIKPWMTFRRPPDNHDVILARYIDYYWYRGRIVSCSHTMAQYLIFFVDYGNYRWTKLSDLAMCNDSIAQLPQRAHLCLISKNNSLRSNPYFGRYAKSYTNRLRRTLLNKTIMVTVEDFAENLMVNIHHEDYDALIEEFKQKLNQNVKQNNLNTSKLTNI